MKATVDDTAISPAESIHLTGRLTQLFIYPVKSLSGIKVDQAVVTAKGLAGDREWMLVNEEGRFVTQRQVAKLATIKVGLTGRGLKLSHPTAGELEALNPAPDAPVKDVIVWQDPCLAQLADGEVSAWLAEALGDDARSPLQLVKFAEGFTRVGNPERFGDATTHFADAAPFLVVNQLSLEALNFHLQEEGLKPVDVRHFRPNLVADGLPAFTEHRVNELKAGPLRWELCDPCQRCAIITVNPDTGERLPQAVPFKQLAALNPMPGNTKAPAFGVNARLLTGVDMPLTTGSDISWRTVKAQVEAV